MKANKKLREEGRQGGVGKECGDDREQGESHALREEKGEIVLVPSPSLF